jgi:hypothetical protein
MASAASSRSECVRPGQYRARESASWRRRLTAGEFISPRGYWVNCAAQLYEDAQRPTASKDSQKTTDVLEGQQNGGPILAISAYCAKFVSMTALPKCPHCRKTLTRKQAARMLASLSAGRAKNFSEDERALRRERMKAINARRTAASFGTGMRHRHLNHRRLTLGAIDDAIDRGQRESWAFLLAAVDASPEIRSRVLRVCEAHVSDDFAGRVPGVVKRGGWMAA